MFFRTSVGTALSARNVQRLHKRLLEKAGLPDSIRFHDLRHTAATHLFSAGVDPITVSAILGHAQPSTTMNLYGHALQAPMAAAAGKLEQALGLVGELPSAPPSPDGAAAPPTADDRPDPAGGGPDGEPRP